jgi:hypothetical protein
MEATVPTNGFELLYLIFVEYLSEDSQKRSKHIGVLSHICTYELLELPGYSSDFAPSDFCLFPKLKLFLAG